MKDTVFPLRLVQAVLKGCNINRDLGQRALCVMHSERYGKPMLQFGWSTQSSIQMCNLTWEQQKEYLRKTGRRA